MPIHKWSWFLKFFFCFVFVGFLLVYLFDLIFFFPQLELELLVTKEYYEVTAVNSERLHSDICLQRLCLIKTRQTDTHWDVQEPVGGPILSLLAFYLNAWSQNNAFHVLTLEMPRAHQCVSCGILASHPGRYNRETSPVGWPLGGEAAKHRHGGRGMLLCMSSMGSHTNEQPVCRIIYPTSSDIWYKLLQAPTSSES